MLMQLEVNMKIYGLFLVSIHVFLFNYPIIQVILIVTVCKIKIINNLAYIHNYQYKSIAAIIPITNTQLLHSHSTHLLNNSLIHVHNINKINHLQNLQIQ